MTTLKTGSSLTTGTGGGDTAAGITVTFASGSQIGQDAFAITDYLNAPIVAVPQLSNGTIIQPGTVLHSIFDTGSMGFNFAKPGGLLFPDGTAAQGMQVWSGTGAPSATTVGCAIITNSPITTVRIGDLYLRRDGSAGSRIYRCTVAGTASTAVWTALAT